MPKWLLFIICVMIPLVVGFTAGYLTKDESRGEWYRSLVKPSFNPPGHVFGPVWTFLYTMMGVTLYLLLRAEHGASWTYAVVAFGIQLILNFFWSLIFFRWHMLGFAAVEIIALLAAIIVMIVLVYRVDPLAAYLQLPYLGWVCFATVLTVTIYWLNRSAGPVAL